MIVYLIHAMIFVAGEGRVVGLPKFHSWGKSPVSGLPSSAEAQISATRASTSVVFASDCTLTVALHWPHMFQSS